MSTADIPKNRSGRRHRQDLDATDTILLKGLSLDGRRSASDLAGDLGVSRAYANRRVQALLKHKGIRIRAFSNPMALGYQAGAMTGIKVFPGQLEAAISALRTFPSVCQLMMTAGRDDIVIFSIFLSAADLSGFLTEDLMKVPGVQSAETMIIADWRVRSMLSEPGTGFYSYLRSPQSAMRPLADSFGLTPDPSRRAGSHDAPTVDILDLRLLREIERDPRQHISELARRAGVSQKAASTRLHALLDNGVTRIGVYPSPFQIGLNFFPLTGLRVSPQEIAGVSGHLESLPEVFWMVRVSGRYDLVVGTMFAGPNEVSEFIRREIVSFPGIISMETTIGLEIRKWSLPYLAGALLDTLAGRTPPCSGKP